MPVGAGRHEEGVVLRHGKRPARAGHGGHHQCFILAARGRVPHYGTRAQREDGRHAVEAERLAVAVLGAEHHRERCVAGGDGEPAWRVDGEAHAAGRKGEAGRELDAVAD
jgi:hypothetical protein